MILNETSDWGAEKRNRRTSLSLSFERLKALRARAIAAKGYRKNFLVECLAQLHCNEYSGIIKGDIDDYKRIIDSGKWDCKHLMDQAKRTLKRGAFIDFDQNRMAKSISSGAFEAEITLFELIQSGEDIKMAIEGRILDHLKNSDLVGAYTAMLYDLGAEYWKEILALEKNGEYRGDVNAAALALYEDKLTVIDIIRMFNYSNYKQAIAKAFLTSQSPLKNLEAVSYVPRSHEDATGYHTDERHFEEMRHEDYWDCDTNPKHPQHIDCDYGGWEHTDNGGAHTDGIYPEHYADVTMEQLMKADF